MSRRWVWFFVLACSLSTSALSAVIPADIYVTTNADSGAGSLRWAVGISNTTTGVQTIGFSVGNSITVLSRIDVTAPAVINGDNNQVIGALGTGSSSILFFTSASAGSTLTGCAFINSSMAVDIQTNGNIVSLCRFGLDFADAAHANATGVRVLSASDNTIQSCVFGNNTSNGALLYNATRARVLGCYVGSLSSGAVCANVNGINLYQSRNCQVGGSLLNASQRNVISGNTLGVLMQESSYNNIICGNIIGLNTAMTAAIPNTYGIRLASQAHDNLIGLAQDNFGNVIAGNTIGIYTYEANPGSQPRTNIIRNNLIGLNPSGTALPNSTGIHLYNADGFLIGGSSLAGVYEANVISGNNNTAVELAGNGNTISGNYIGTDASGTLDRGNGGDGIYMESLLVGANTITCRGNLIGGPKTTNRGNVVSGNGGCGIVLETADANEISGNLVGLSVNSTALPNSVYGILLSTATGNRLGRPDADCGNVVSGQANDGIYLRTHSDGNTLCGNIVGLTRNQSAALPNSPGITVDGSHGNAIGLPTGSYGYNVVAGNSSEGIYLSDANYNRIQNNFIGLSSGNAVFGNDYGVSISDGWGNLVGGNRLANEGNVISGNLNEGVILDASSGNTVCGNVIGLSSDQTQARGNGASGIRLGSGAGAHHNAVGLPQAGWGNIIGANDLGFYLLDADDNTVQNNVVGLNSADVSFPNTQAGIYASAADRNLFGGSGGGNIIASSAPSTIRLIGSHNNTVSANTINLNAAGNSLLANYSESAAIQLQDSLGNLIGGSSPADRNLICGRKVQLDVIGTSSGNTIVGNTFGQFANGQPIGALSATAVKFSGSSHDNLLGENGQGNQITGGSLGVWADGAGVVRNGFYQNLISGQSTKAISLTNSSNYGIAAPVIATAFGQTITGQTQFFTDVVEVFQAEASSNTYTSGGSLRYLGRAVVTGSGAPAPWSIVASSVGGEWICATTSDTNQNTSEFSYNVLNTGPTPTPTVTPIVTPTATPTPTAPAVTSTSTPIQIDWKGAKVLAFPNPAKGQMTFAVQAPEAGNLTIALYNLSGERIASLQESVTAGTVMLVWDCSGTAPGVYVARVMVNSRELTKLKVAVLK